MRFTLCVAALCMLFSIGCADTLILRPTTNPVDSGGASRRMIGGDTIEIWIARSPGTANRKPEAYLLEFCGNGTRAESIATYVANRWKDKPVEVWVMNYPGYGGSAGKASLKLIPPAALKAYDELAKHAEGSPIIVGAHSLGTTAALYVAVNRHVSGVFLHNPPALKSVILGEYGWWNLWLIALPVSAQIPGELDSIANAQHCTCPAVIVTAGKDEIVPAEYHRMIIDAYVGPRRIIDMPEATHGTAIESNHAAELESAIDWLWQMKK